MHAHTHTQTTGLWIYRRLKEHVKNSKDKQLAQFRIWETLQGKGFSLFNREITEFTEKREVAGTQNKIDMAASFPQSK